MAQKYPIDYEEFETIKAMGYTIHKKSPWHFRIRQEDSHKFIDVFPTTRKFCSYNNGQFSSSLKYTNLVEVVEAYLDTFSTFIKEQK